MLIISETSLGRMTGKGPVGAVRSFGKSLPFHFGGRLNSAIPILIIPYYSVIGGWVIKYLVEYLKANMTLLSEDSYFTSFISDSKSTEIWFVLFAAIVFFVILTGVKNGVERVSKIMMPMLVVLAFIVAVYSVT